MYAELRSVYTAILYISCSDVPAYILKVNRKVKHVHVCLTMRRFGATCASSSLSVSHPLHAESFTVHQIRTRTHVRHHAMRFRQSTQRSHRAPINCTRRVASRRRRRQIIADFLLCAEFCRCRSSPSSSPADAGMDSSPGDHVLSLSLTLSPMPAYIYNV